MGGLGVPLACLPRSPAWARAPQTVAAHSGAGAGAGCSNSAGKTAPRLTEAPEADPAFEPEVSQPECNGSGLGHTPLYVAVLFPTSPASRCRGPRAFEAVQHPGTPRLHHAPLCDVKANGDDWSEMQMELVADPVRVAFTDFPCASRIYGLPICESHTRTHRQALQLSG
jgi:hypothetical protein